VFWAKALEASKAEILNDADGELINFYHVLHKSGRRLAREVDAMPYGRRWFEQMLQSRPRSAFGRAARFWYLNRVAFGAQRHKPAFGVSASRRVAVLPSRILAQLDTIIERLRGVVFEAVDLVRLVQLYDRPTTLFYIDPPFYGTAQPYACTFDAADHARLAESLAAVKGAWLLSYNDCKEVRRLYRGRSIISLDVDYLMGCNSSTGGYRQAHELLISNRRLKAAKLKDLPDAAGTRSR